MKKLLLLSIFTVFLNADYYVISLRDKKIIAKDYQQTPHCIMISQKLLIDSNLENKNNVIGAQFCGSYSIVKYPGKYLK